MNTQLKAWRVSEDGNNIVSMSAVINYLKRI